MQLFSITTRDGNETVNVDFTSNITVPSYKVNNFDEGDEWVDGNKKKHKNVIRTRVKGNFTLKFLDPQSFNNFFAILNENKVPSGDNAGAVLVSAYVQNENTVKSFYAFISADPADTLPLMADQNYEGFTVQIEEV